MRLADLTRVFARIGLLSFGGPAAQIALMQREVVDRAWITQSEFLSALSFCMLLPGPEAMQLATWIGWRKHGVLGGLIAGGLFVAPGALIMLGLAMAYAAYGTLPMVAALFLGVQAAVLAVVVQALIRLSKRALISRAAWVLAGLAWAALDLLQLPFPLIIALAAAYGFWTSPRAKAAQGPLPWRDSLRAAVIWGAVWLLPLGLILWQGDPFLADIALFFSKLALFTFGGAYAVLAWMASEVVTGRGWITAPQMVAALGLAETTPGPLILVTEFVAYLAGHTKGGMGLAAAAIALWMTFTPCFLWIFAGAPWIAHLTQNSRAKGALQAIMAAVVGVIAHVSLWFALHVLFGRQIVWHFGPLRPLLPDLTSAQPIALGLAAMAAYLLARHWSLPLVLAVSALTSALVALF